MICENGINAAKIIEGLGTFNPNEKPLKRGARIGQNFSSTKRVKRLA